MGGTQPKEYFEECLCPTPNETSSTYAVTRNINCPIHGKNMEKKMEWCEHLIWRYRTSTQKGRWFFKGLHEQFDNAIADEWILCPLCGAKRPCVQLF